MSHIQSLCTFYSVLLLVTRKRRCLKEGYKIRSPSSSSSQSQQAEDPSVN